MVMVWEIMTNDWFLVIIAAVLYWTMDKPAGGRLLIVLALSIYFHGLIKQMFFPVPPDGNGGFTFPAKQVQTAVAFWGYLLFEVRDRRFTWLSFSMILIVAGTTFLYTSHTVENILMGGLIGAFIVYVVYRSMDWIAAMPEPFLFSFSLVFPSSLLLLFPDGALYAGLLLGSGAGYSVERLKCRTELTNELYKKAITAVIGGAGLLLIIAAGTLLPPVSVLVFLHAAAAGIWITLFLPFLSLRLGLNQQSGKFQKLG
ncbi:hypothetical protein [Salibacterium halotolerans]|uniref:PAP2 superfamily protein n=1 Tax=Salibacterium halotolerans TaxID=1884432 RepID=A0A1I5NM80_9BACI|nr:hypothetical protein [Salibacterium halotolerans]SFP22915.1 hypothetical protein SAMN05518683_103208 [Salibacterium halotolerans]